MGWALRMSENTWEISSASGRSSEVALLDSTAVPCCPFSGLLVQGSGIK